VATEVNDGGPKPAKLAKQVERLRGPARDELKLITVPTSLKLDLDRPRFLVEGETVAAQRIGREEQDDLLGHGATTQCVFVYLIPTQYNDSHLLLFACI